jgi:chitin disaccharide deacetylase
VSQLTWRLGLGERTKAVIITADDLGLCHAANVACFGALSSGLATSASLLMVGPWAREAAARYRGEDVGVSLAITAEHELLRFGPLTQAPSLLGGDGGFASTSLDALDHADLDEVRRECRAQLERAVLWGFNLTHLAAHQGALLERPEFFDVVLELAQEYQLPLRLPSGGAEAVLGFPARSLAQRAEVISPDLTIDASPEGLRSAVGDLAGSLVEGVTEIVVRPAEPTEELHAFAEDAAVRIDDLHLLTREAGVKAALRDAGATLIGWRPLLELARRHQDHRP